MAEVEVEWLDDERYCITCGKPLDNESMGYTCVECQEKEVR